MQAPARLGFRKINTGPLVLYKEIVFQRQYGFSDIPGDILWPVVNTRTFLAIVSGLPSDVRKTTEATTAVVHEVLPEETSLNESKYCCDTVYRCSHGLSSLPNIRRQSGDDGEESSGVHNRPKDVSRDIRKVVLSLKDDLFVENERSGINFSEPQPRWGLHPY